jgi:hypothetical protein
MTQPVQLTNTHLTIIGEKIEIKNDRFYATSEFFESILNEYKRDTDFWKDSHYRKGEKIEIIINIIEPEYAYLESTKVTLRAFNMQGRLIWISSPIEENHFYIMFKKVVAYVTAFVVIAGLGYLAFR